VTEATSGERLIDVINRAGVEISQVRYDRGVLELLRGAMGSGDKILEILVEASKTSEAIRGIRNLLIVTKVVESIRPRNPREIRPSCSRRACRCRDRARKRAAKFVGSFAHTA
jgi:hypothetical protein